jgi:hypothetical protein
MPTHETLIDTTSKALALPTDDEINVLADAARDLAPSDLMGLPLKFAKGIWLAGKGDASEEVGQSEPFIADIRSYTVVWIRWKDRKPMQKIGGRRVDGWISPPRHALPDQDQSRWPLGKKGPQDPWQETHMLLLRDVRSQLYTFSSPSYGAAKGIGELLDAYVAEQRRSRNGKMPAVVLGSRDRMSPDYGRIAEPTFRVCGWEEFGPGASPPPNPARVETARQALLALPKPAAAQGGALQPVRGDMDDAIPF